MKYFEHTEKWKDGGNVGIVLYPDRLNVDYAVGADREEVRETFRFDTVTNNYGGAYRYYFDCPYCGRRVRFLYLHKRHFKCRICANLNYFRQRLNNANEDISIYKMRRILKDGFKITEDLSPMDASRYRPERPPGMHQKTYIRLSIQLLRAQEEYTNHLWAFVGRLSAK